MSAPRRWAIVNEAGEVENVALWDGATEWTPPEGCRLVEDSDGRLQPGDVLDADDTPMDRRDAPEDVGGIDVGSLRSKLGEAATNANVRAVMSDLLDEIERTQSTTSSDG